MRSRRFFHKKSSKNCPPGGVTIFGQPAATDISCTSEIPPPSLAKMDGVIVTVVHDEFRGMGVEDLREFVGEGAVVVGVMGCLMGIWDVGSKKSQSI